MKDLVSMGDLSKQDILDLLEFANEIEKGTVQQNLRGKIGILLFTEPSTRTLGSFKAAIYQLDGHVIEIIGTENNSIKKGEDIDDTIKTNALYGDFIVMRTPEEGVARRAAELVGIPIINAGDGSNQHPTQALLDIFSIKKTQRNLENLTIGFVGDLKFSRTVHSLIKAMTLFNARFKLISPNFLKIPDSFIRDLKEANIDFEELDDMESVIKELDILYVTRVQKERFADPEDYERVKGSYILTASMLNGVKPNLKVFHAMPRVDEIDRNVDTTPYAYYFKQAKNGITMRKAILLKLLYWGK